MPCPFVICRDALYALGVIRNRAFSYKNRFGYLRFDH
jgi:hypothetical protein